MTPTRIAIATTDGISVCGHLARSTAFLILEIQDGAIVSGTFRSRPTDTCGNHAGFVEMLAGANAVMCGGIGQGAASNSALTASDVLAAHGIEPLVLDGAHSIDDAVNGFLAGSLKLSGDRVCLCRNRRKLRFQTHLRKPVAQRVAREP
jgi:predicted Fe-Mo cluster-binding NifX family protein